MLALFDYQIAGDCSVGACSHTHSSTVSPSDSGREARDTLIRGQCH